MPRSLTDQLTHVRQHSRHAAAILLAGVSGVALASLAGLASAKSPATTLKVATNVLVDNAKHETLVVDSHGVALYDLLPETTHNALCKSANGCFSPNGRSGIWVPVTVASGKAKVTAAAGIKGQLGTWHRDGFFQVTLAGHPLYTFAGDNGHRGIATGDRIHSFNGVWHVITATSPKKTTHTTTMPTTTTTTPTTTTPTTPVCSMYQYPPSCHY